MAERAYDQTPDPWSRAASGYASRFEGFTALYVDEALDLLGVGPGDRVLDVAAGSGVVTAGALARGAQVVATDFAHGMTAHIAANRADSAGAPPPVAVMDAQHIAVVDGSFDAAISMFGVMFVPDAVLGIGEMRRATRPGAQVAVGTWELDAFNLSNITGAAIARTFPGAPKAPPPTWAPLGTADGLTEAMEGAGLVDVAVTVVQRWWLFDDAEAFFLTGPEWSPPLQPFFDSVGVDNVKTVSEAFAAVVAETTAAEGGKGVPNSALVAVGRVPG